MHTNIGHNNVVHKILNRKEVMKCTEQFVLTIFYRKVLYRKGCTEKVVQEMLYRQLLCRKECAATIVQFVLYRRNCTGTGCTDRVVQVNIGQNLLYREMWYRKYHRVVKIGFL